MHEQEPPNCSYFAMTSTYPLFALFFLTVPPFLAAPGGPIRSSIDDPLLNAVEGRDGGPLAVPAEPLNTFGGARLAVWPLLKGDSVRGGVLGIEGERDSGGALCGGCKPLREIGGALAVREGGEGSAGTGGAVGAGLEAEVLLGGPEKDLGVDPRGGGGVAAGADVVAPAF